MTKKKKPLLFRRNRDYSGSREDYIKNILHLADHLDNRGLYKAADHLDTILYDNEWVQLKQTPDGYVYTHEIRCNGEIVVVLLIDQTKEKPILGRYERTPAHHPNKKTTKDVPIELTSLTGGLEEDLTPEETAVKEVEEESGYKIDQADLINLGTVRPSKSEDTIVHLFAADIEGKERRTAKGDGSKGEQDAYCDWITIEQAIGSKDPLLSTLVLRYLTLE